jgi:hypothetical protein
MLAATPNPALIRVVLIVLFLVISQILRAAKKSSSSKPAPEAAPGKGSQIGEVLREAMRQAADPTRGRQSGQAVNAEPQVSEQFQQPPTTEPESSFVPSLLLLALFACLCLMAYRYWAR